MNARLNRPREEQALRELGHTDVGTGLGGLLVGAFLLSILSVGVVQHLGLPLAPKTQGVDGSSASVPFRWAELLGELPTDCSLESFERRMEDALVSRFKWRAGLGFAGFFLGGAAATLMITTRFL